MDSAGIEPASADYYYELAPSTSFWGGFLAASTRARPLVSRVSSSLRAVLTCLCWLGVRQDGDCDFLFGPISREGQIRHGTIHLVRTCFVYQSLLGGDPLEYQLFVDHVETMSSPSKTAGRELSAPPAHQELSPRTERYRACQVRLPVVQRCPA